MARSYLHLMSLPDGPGHSAFTIVPHDTDQLQQNGEDCVIRKLYVGGTGDITARILTESGSAATVVFKAIPVGTILEYLFTHIHSTGTDATFMLGAL